MFRSANPAFNADTFEKMRERAEARDDVMTVQGTVNRVALMMILVFGSAAFTWTLFLKSGLAAILPFWIGGLVVGLVLAIVTIFKKKWAPVTGPLYAVAEGLLLGGLSAWINTVYPGIAMQAVILTFAVAGLVLGLYLTRIIRATPRFTAGIIAATGAVFVLYLVTWVLGMFGVELGFLHDGGWLSIAIAGVIVVIAALNLVLDFALIEEGAEAGMPRYMEWYAAFGLTVTLVWLYLEILRLLSLLNRR